MGAFNYEQNEFETATLVMMNYSQFAVSSTSESVPRNSRNRFWRGPIPVTRFGIRALTETRSVTYDK
jgi:hypothetical protein